MARSRRATYRDVNRAINKLVGDTRNGLVIGSGAERTSWYYIDGRKATRMTIGQEHSGTVPPGTQKSLMRQMQVTPEQFFLLVDCPWSGSDYRNHIVGL